ncbi:MAG: CoA-binding protein [Anaerolineae bacterium]
MTTIGDLISDFISRRRWAVVGVSADPSKYGHKIFANLLGAGYEVVGVNPKNGQVLGRDIYRSLADLPEPPEVVDIVVPPTVTEQVVRQCAELGLTRVWMQPGAESQAAISFCLDNGIEAVWGECAMVHRHDRSFWKGKP